MTCRYWSSFAGALSLALASMLNSAHAGELPPVRATKANVVAECATPGRLMAYLRDNNPALLPKFDSVASEYMRHGEALGLRWDYAFFQMLLETGYLRFTGDVKPDQNNFAGLGATGKGVRGESFKDVSTGVRAHIEHLLMYSGTHVDNPVAERTRNVQEWGVLVPWQKSIGQPVNFTQLAKQWAPGSRRYASDIESIAQRFYTGRCLGSDPEPQLIADAQGASAGKAKAKDKAKTAQAQVKPLQPKPDAAREPQEQTADAKTQDNAQKAKDVADRAIEEQRKDGKKVALGAKDVAGSETVKPAASVADATADEARSVSDFAPQKAQPPIKILNAESEPAAAAPADEPAKAEKSEKAAQDKAAGKPAKTEKSEKTEKTDTKAPEQKTTKVATLSTPGLGSATAKADKKAAAAPAPSAGKCRVWTASYGGSKAIIIRAVVDKTTNYTVLDVNEGAERREADAYIDAYAKGGEKVGEFSSQPQALEKAFELCPEG